jgi:hypothetical protein
MRNTFLRVCSSTTTPARRPDAQPHRSSLPTASPCLGQAPVLGERTVCRGGSGCWSRLSGSKGNQSCLGINRRRSPCLVNVTLPKPSSLPSPLWAFLRPPKPQGASILICRPALLVCYWPCHQTPLCAINTVSLTPLLEGARCGRMVTSAQALPANRGSGM